MERPPPVLKSYRPGWLPICDLGVACDAIHAPQNRSATRLAARLVVVMSCRVRPSSPLVAVVAATVLVACGGGDGDADADGPPASLSPAAATGRDVVAAAGCAACHGADGRGGIGPAWVGLYGSTVTLEDGTTVVADNAYLTRAVSDPDAERVEGFALKMPANDLSPEQVAQVVAYLRELGAPGS